MYVLLLIIILLYLLLGRCNIYGFMARLVKAIESRRLLLGRCARSVCARQVPIDPSSRPFTGPRVAPPPQSPSHAGGRHRFSVAGILALLPESQLLRRDLGRREHVQIPMVRGGGVRRAGRGHLPRRPELLRRHRMQHPRHGAGVRGPGKFQVLRRELGRRQHLPIEMVRRRRRRRSGRGRPLSRRSDLLRRHRMQPPRHAPHGITDALPHRVQRHVEFLLLRRDVRGSGGGVLDRDALPVGEAGRMRPRVVLLGRRGLQRDRHADVAADRFGETVHVCAAVVADDRSGGTDQVARRYGCMSSIVAVNRFAGD